MMPLLMAQRVAKSQAVVLANEPVNCQNARKNGIESRLKLNLRSGEDVRVDYDSSVCVVSLLSEVSKSIVVYSAIST